jgi:hypothetical protein
LSDDQDTEMARQVHRVNNEFEQTEGKVSDEDHELVGQIHHVNNDYGQHIQEKLPDNQDMELFA